MKKLALIVDKSTAFINYQKETIFNEWGLELAQAKSIQRINEAGASTLFGPAPTSILELPDSDSVKTFVKDASNLEKNIDDLIASGLLIITSLPRNSTRKLEESIEKLGGIVVMSNPGKGSKDSAPGKLVKDLNLSPTVKNFVLEYVGQDYEAVIPIIRTLSNLTPQQQRQVTEEDIYLRLPQAPGAIAPWELEKPLLAGNTAKTIELFRRISKHSHHLVVLKLLNNKMQLAFRVAALLEETPKASQAQIAEQLGVTNNWTLKTAIDTARKHKLEKMSKIVLILAKAESEVKGYSGADSRIIMEKTLVTLVDLLR